MHKRRFRPSHSTVVAYVALFFALAGTAVAGGYIKQTARTSSPLNCSVQVSYSGGKLKSASSCSKLKAHTSAAGVVCFKSPNSPESAAATDDADSPGYPYVYSSVRKSYVTSACGSGYNAVVTTYAENGSLADVYFSAVIGGS